MGLRKWTYYHYDLLVAGQEATFRLHETNSNPIHDCDLYAQIDDYPTRNSYFRKDTGLRRDAEIKLNGTDPRGTWYLGVFGFLGCSFELSVTAPSSACPNGCSGSGTCQGGVCTCNAGFGGPDCSIGNSTITFGTAVQGHVLRRNWTYFYFDQTQTKELIVVKLNSPHDTDLYLRKNSFPTLFAFDAVNASTPLPGKPDEATVMLQSPEATRWYIGVYGWEESDYTLLTTASVYDKSCPNNCSLSTHGTCNGGRCSCKQGYHGDACEFKDYDLRVGETGHGFVDNGQWNYFSVSPNSDSMLNITAMMDTSVTPNGDCDLYIKAGSMPNRTSFDAADLGFGTVMHLSVTSPGDQRYYLGVFGWRGCAFNITAVYADAASDCGAHGKAQDDTCVCDAGYYGEECELQATPLVSGAAALQGTVGTGTWQYYVMTASATAFTVTVKESSPGARGGLVALYAQLDTPPTERDNLEKDKSQSSMHFVHVEFPSVKMRTVLFGVFANGFGGEHDTTPFKISGFAF